MLSMSLVGCTPNSEKKQNANKVKIMIGCWPGENLQQALKVIEAKKVTFETKYPNVEVVRDSWAYAVDSFLLKASSNQLPTLYNSWFTEVKKIADAGYAADITDALKKNGYLDAINPAILDILTKDGKVYALPTEAYAMGIAINMNLFRQAGLVNADGSPKVPDTYEELIKTAQIIKEKTGKPGFAIPSMTNNGGWRFMNIAWSYGTEFMKQKDGKWIATFDSPEFIAALQYIKDLKWKYDVMPENALIDGEEIIKLYATDQIGMTLGEPNYLKNMSIDAYKMNRNNISFAKIPAGPKGRYSLMGGDIQIFSNAATPEQIDAGIKWLELGGVTPEITEETATQLDAKYKLDNEKGSVVGINGLRIWGNPERVKKEKEIQAKYVNVDLGLFKTYEDYSDVTLRPEEPMNCQELYKTLDNCLQSVLTDKNADLPSIAKKAASDFQKNYLDKAK